MNMQAFTVLKNDSTVTATYPASCSATPILLMTPVYTTAVGATDYVAKADSESCTISSKNVAADYHVNVLAVDSGAGSFGTLKFIAGIQTKIKPEIKIDITNGHLNSRNPVTIISANWKGSGNLGGIDTVDDASKTEISVVSINSASDYQVSYISADIGIGTQGGQVLQTGIANKTGGGTLRVYFTQKFSEIPTVFLTPWWNDQGAAVGSVETLLADETTIDYFELTSGNTATNYYVNWMALGS